MDLFVSLALLIALAILFSALQRERIGDVTLYQKAVGFFIAAIVVHNPAMDFIGMIPHVAFAFLAAIGRIIGWILLLISFHALCRAWGAPLKAPSSDQPRPGL